MAKPTKSSKHNPGAWVRFLLAAFFLGTIGAAGAREGTLPDAPKLPPADSGAPPKAPAPALSRGELLYENHCTACHTSVAHVRENRRAKSTAEVRSWVERWAGEMKLGWNQAELDDVTQYLARRYYKFDTKPRAAR